MKKLLCVLLVITMIFAPMALCVPSAAAGAPQIKLEEVKGNPGDTVKMNMYILNNPGIMTFSLDIMYDTSELILMNATLASGIDGQFLFFDKPTWIGSKDSTYSGLFMTLEFKVRGSVIVDYSDVTVSWNEGDICNYNEENVAFEVVPGKIVYRDSLVIGDLNGDKKVTAADCNLLKKLYVGTISTIYNIDAADIDRDTKITLMDINRIKSLIIGTD